MLFLVLILDYGCAALLSGKKWRWIVYGVLAVALLRTDFIGIFLGYVLCDFMYTNWKVKENICSSKVLNWVFFAVGLYFPCATLLQDLPRGNDLWGILPFVFVNYYHLFGVLLFVFSVLNLEPVQQFFLGSISVSGTEFPIPCI